MGNRAAVLRGEVAAVRSALEKLEKHLRDEARDGHGIEKLKGEGGDDPAWKHLEDAADAVNVAVAALLDVRAHVEGASIRGWGEEDE